MKREQGTGNREQVKMRKIFVTFIIFLLIGCSAKETVILPAAGDFDTSTSIFNNRKNLKIGVVPGPYGEMFMDAVYPSLKEKGYTFELVYYDDYTKPNFYLAQGEIDLNIFQHYLYLINFKFEYDYNLSAIAEIPTVSMGIFSSKIKSLDDIRYSSTVSLPEDSTNFVRALMVLEDAGVIKLNPEIDKTKARMEDIISNPKNIRLFPLAAHTLASRLSEFDIAVINGNYAVSYGLDLKNALFTERLDAYYYNIIAVRTEDLKEQFVDDIIKVIRSDEYRNAIKNPEKIYSEFQRPLNFYEQLAISN